VNYEAALTFATKLCLYYNRSISTRATGKSANAHKLFH